MRAGLAYLGVGVSHVWGWPPHASARHAHASHDVTRHDRRVHLENVLRCAVRGVGGGVWTYFLRSLVCQWFSHTMSVCGSLYVQY